MGQRLPLRRTVGAVACLGIAVSATATGQPALAASNGSDAERTGASATADASAALRAGSPIKGSSGNDRLTGRPGPDVIVGGAGKDVLVGGKGADVLRGGPGPDVLRGGAGPDVLRGGAGPDLLICGPGKDTVYRSANDTLRNCDGDTIVSTANPLSTPFNQATTMPARLQWNSNYGYCGETSFISAGLQYGQYTSQWTARNLASGGGDEWDAGNQLLLGSPPDGNALPAAAAMKLSATARYTNTAKTSTYLAWVKQEFLAGNVVIMGVFNNVNILGEGGSGDALYDHIVPVMGIGSQQPLTGANAKKYFATDTITISDNGLYTPHPNSQPNVPGNTANNPTASALYTYQFGKFQKTRAQANRGSSVADLYSIRSQPSNFAVSVSGIVDTTPGGPVTIPVRLTASTNNEGFQNDEYLYSAPTATPLTLTAHVTIPDQTKDYKLYLYDDFAKVPTQDFNAQAANAINEWDIPAGSGSSVTIPVSANTGQNRIFRAVPTDAS